MALTKVKSEQLDAAQTSITSVGTLTGLTVSGDLTVDTSTFVVDATNNRVGIGTTSPSAGLHVLADVNPVIKLDRGSANNANANLYYNGTLTGQISAANADFQISAVGSSTPMSFYTNGAEGMRIDASGNVGIGTTPSGVLSFGYVLRLNGGTQTFLAFNNTTHTTQATGGFVIGHDASSSYIVQRENQPLDFYTNNLFRMRIDASGNLIVGNTSDSAASSITLQGDGDIRGVLSSGAGGDTLISAISGVSNGYQIVVDTSNNQSYRWHNGGTQSMTLDSSGNLLVGGTNTAPGAGNTVAGVAIRGGSDNRSFFSANSNYVAAFNRNTNDGNIVEFNKDGSAVGSIGSTSGVVTHIVLDPRSSLKGAGIVGGSISASEGVINPTNKTGGIENGNINLGGSGSRWKDLYLSGGAYLGGTAAADKLDDYEEGTWTPTIQGSSGASGQSYAFQHGRFTKVGSFVHYTFDVNLSALGTLLGTYVVISGLPFPGNAANLGGTANIGYHSGIGGNLPLGAYISGSNVYLMEQGNSGSDYMLISENKIGNSGRLIGSLLVYTPN